MTRSPLLPWTAAAALAALAGGCAVGPNYRRPDAHVPAAFKEVAGWKAAAPADASPRGPWWQDFHDPLLSDLAGQVAAANQTLRQSAANYEAAREAARAERATFFPTLGIDASATRSKSRSGGATTVGGQVISSGSNPVNTYGATGSASWSPDFWGRVRRQTEADVAAAQADAAALASARLSIQAELATDYLELRILDARRQLLINAEDSYQRTLQIAQNKYKAGVAARNDVITAQTQLDSTRAQVIDTRIQRAQLEHAIAVLIGKAPADFAIAPREAVGIAVPAIPPQLPSALLERRPDVAQSERSVVAANARIGVQVAAYFPNLSLTAQGGFQGSPVSKLFTLPFRFWSLGAAASDTLLDFGARSADVRGAEAGYDAAVAGYRQTVLTALQQVEDHLAALRLLAEESAVQQNAVSDAAQASKIAENEYRAGTVDYTTVVTAQVTELNNRETALQIEQNRLSNSIALIQALGGGWEQSDLPSSGQVLARKSQAPEQVAAPR